MIFNRTVTPALLLKTPRKLTRSQKPRRALVELFEPRLLLSGNYLPADLTGTWSLAGLNKTGSLTFDGISAITAGAWTNQNGSPDTQIVPGLGSNFTLDTDATFVAELDTLPTGSTVGTAYSLGGIMNATRDILPLNELSAGIPLSDGLDILINHTGTFTTTDLAGTWNIAADDFRGTIKINAAGHVTGGSIFLLSNQKNSTITGGTATLNANGTGTLAINTNFTSSAFATIALGLTMNSSKDVVVANNANIGQPVTGGNAPAQLTVLLKSAGTYASSDLIGVTWTLNSALGLGNFTFHANRTITGILLAPNGIPSVLTGNFSIGGNGTVITNITATGGGTVSHFSLTGAINRARNLVALDRAIANPGTNSSLTILTSPANHAPTNRALAVLPQSAFQASSITIDFPTLAAATSAHDLDGDTLSFRITAVPPASGTLAITHNGTTSAVIVGTTTMVSGDTLTWTPSVTVLGQVNAFSIKAFDGDALAANATRIVVSTAKNAVVSAKALKPFALESKAGTHAGDGKIQIQRVGGDISQPLDVTLAIAGTAQQGVNYQLLAPNGITVLSSATPIVTIPAGQTTITLTIAPLNDNAVDPDLTVLITISPDPNTITPLYIPSVHPTAHATIIDASPLVSITPRQPRINEGDTNVRTFIITRLPAQGANVNNSLTVNLAYAGTFDTSHYLTAPSSITFAPGELKKVVTLTTLDNHTANATQTLTATISGTGFATSGSGIATVNVLDAAPVVRITRDDAVAVEGNPSNKAKFTIHRTGPTTSPLTVAFDTATGGSFGTLGTNYTLTDSLGNPLTTSVVIPAGKRSITISLTAIDDFANDPTLHPVITLQPDAGPSYHVGNADQVTLNIINNNRRPTVANATASQNTTLNNAINLTYSQLVSLMGATLAPGETNGTLQLKVIAKFAGTLQIIPSGSATPNAAPIGTLINTGDTLVWSPPVGQQAVTLNAFRLSALDGTLTAALTSKFSVTIS